jgi:hypothetical protein
MTRGPAIHNFIKPGQIRIAHGFLDIVDQHALMHLHRQPKMLRRNPTRIELPEKLRWRW